MFSKPRRTAAMYRALVSAGLIATVACTNVIVPPRDPLQPRPVFVLDHGRHASLVLPASDSVLVRYAYGDWDYYAKAETGVGEASAAVLLPTAAGLGRRALAEPATEDGVRSALRVGVEAVYEVIVDSAAAGRLLEVLDSIFDADRESLFYNRGYDLEFVRHPRRYTIFRNSNWMVADWLRQLGCRVSGLLLFSKWKLDTPSPLPAAAGERDPAAASRMPATGIPPRTRR
jgi:hypothetical protein